MQTQMRFRTAAVMSCVLLAACRSGPVPNQVFTKPAPVRAAAPPVARTGGPWVNRPSAEIQRFTIDQHAVVTIGLDTAARPDTLTSHAEVSFTDVPSAHSVNGTVSAFLVGGAGHEPATPPGLQVPFSFRAGYPAANSQLAFTAPADTAQCSSSALAAAQSLRDLWFEAPDTLRVGAMWSDSASYITCRDGIPLHAVVHRMFHVSASANRDGRALLSIARLSRTVIDGRGLQFGDSVTVTGAGNGQLTYDFDPARGEVISASGNATLDISLRGSQRTQIVRQIAEIRIGRS
jgi:hypothetical protein